MIPRIKPLSRTLGSTSLPMLLMLAIFCSQTGFTQEPTAPANQGEQGADQQNQPQPQAPSEQAQTGGPGGQQDAPPPPPPPGENGWRRFGQPGNNPGNNNGAPQGPGGQFSYPQNQPAVPPQLTVPAGTWISVRVNQPLSSDSNHAGDGFNATLVQPLVANGLVVAQRGQMVGGRITESVKAGRVSGTSHLGLELMEMGLVDGQQVPIKTEFVSASGGTSKGADAAAIASTTAVGAAIGGAVGGGFGAGMGAIGGAVVSTIGVLSTRGRPTVVVPEQQLTFRLAAPLVVSTERSAQAFQPAPPPGYDQPALAVHQPAPGYYAAAPGYPAPGYYAPGYYAGVYPYGYGYGWGYPGYYGPQVSFYYGAGYYGAYGRGYWGGGYRGGYGGAHPGHH